MPQTVTPFLMFQGAAADALALYTRVFPDARVAHLDPYGPEDGAAAGLIRGATLHLAGGLTVRVSDSPVPHAFTFTPSSSLFVDCTDGAEFEALYAGLSEGGGVLMPPADYGFSARFAWVNDPYGVSWQLNVPHPPEPGA
ncbi:putative 3-demethylubiquinone-9 3-methyltransferase (glyoxalase superfamily) [Deinococcus metalli]|uniref:Putative 3-demethylubiquinone-9 3-methyltransferase (Glyoxalase superfamily) n=1 Tax=Deinococcus metalli TaxID=1141878 RepID=A0A7W8KF18_9DEIO|nr:VOC family protein [Deinococcus metalli]MBB5376990.1 putative 3-demethylubiquinone-9 3-methyltransferase (glyoxalase superfamily) [Deinococcus metalli]GHF46870.1 VOC family protein [Deinococcus metalli]